MRAASPDLGAYERARQQVSAWLRQAAHTVRTIKASDKYPTRGVRAGWSLEIDVAGSSHTFDLLLPGTFPYARARIGVAKDLFLVWPHVEEDGILCLPPFVVDATDAIANVKDALSTAIGLAELVAAGAGGLEFEREFVSYWAHQKSIPKGKEFLTLFDPAGSGRPLHTAVGFRDVVVVGDDLKRLKAWLLNAGVDRPKFGAGLYLPLTRPMSPPYPATAGALITFIKTNLASSDGGLLNQPTGDGRAFHFVLGGDVDGKRGLVGCSVTLNKTPNGFRAGHIPFSALMTLGALTASEVDRADAPWIHGRDANPESQLLAGKVVTVLGCGSLGSMTAVRLAQSGVGGFQLFDPESLNTANTGRHALGLQQVGLGKARALGQYLKRRFPHLRVVEPIGERWERSTARAEVFKADLVISAIGEAGPELLLNEELTRRGADPPVIYGWMEAGALAAHALAIVRTTSCLRCILGSDGMMIVPEVLVGAEHELVSEPACGAWFDPFGPVNLGGAELLVADLALDVLLGRVSDNQHNVFGASQAHLERADARWSVAHLAMRPPNWRGSLTFVRPMPNPTLCASGFHS